MGFNGQLSNPQVLNGTLSNEILRGYSAYQIAVMLGFEGTEAEWIESLRGGGQAEPGGYYTLDITNKNEDTIIISFIPSEPNMDAIPPKEISLPRGKDGTDGKKGEDGGYYTPSVSQISEDAIDFAFSPSKNNMNPVSSVNVKLPKGSKGDKGDTGADGKDGLNGKDGYTPQKGVDYFDGVKGDKGDKGDAGYTPQKGIDYFTDADKQELVNNVLNALPAAEEVSY